MRTLQNITLAEYAQQALNMMDLTSLTDTESAEDIITLCNNAKSARGNTAAICIFPRFIPLAKKTLAAQGTPAIKIATCLLYTSPSPRD